MLIEQQVSGNFFRRILRRRMEVWNEYIDAHRSLLIDLPEHEQKAQDRWREQATQRLEKIDLELASFTIGEDDE